MTRRTSLLIVAAALIPFLPMLVSGHVPSLRDHVDYFVPLRHFTAEHLQRFELPLWNPFSGSGERWLANPQTGVFYPPVWLFVFLPFPAAYVLFLALHLAIAGVGAQRLVRRSGGSDEAALLAGVGIVVAGPILSLLDVSNNLATFAWMPHVIWAALQLSDAPRRISRGGAILLLSLLFLGGEPFLAAAGAVIFAAIVLVRSRLAGVKELAIAGVGTMLLVAAQLVPFLELLAGSDRLAGLDPALVFRNSFDAREWLAAPIPPTGMDIHPRILSRSQQFIVSLYIPLLFAGGAILGMIAAVRRRERSLAWWWLLLIIATIFAAGNRLGGLSDILMVVEQFNRYPSKLLPLAALVFFVVAPLMLDRAWSSGERVAGMILTIVVAVAAVVRHGSSNPGVWLFQIAILLIWTAMLALVLFTNDVRRRRLLLASTFLVFVDGWWSGRSLFRNERFAAEAEPYNQLLVRSGKVLRLEEGSMEDRRLWLGGYTNLMNHQFDASTAAPVIPFRYLVMHDAVLLRPRLDIADFLSIRYLIAQRVLTGTSFSPIARIETVGLYENRRALPMVTYWSDFLIAADDDEAFRAFGEGRIDARRRVIVTASPALEGLAPSARIARGELERLELSARRARAIVRVPQRMIVALNQLDAPGWVVKIDGREAAGITVNAMFRGVVVPPGRHDIVWSYRPAWLVPSILVTLFTALLVAVDWYRFRRSRLLSEDQTQSPL